MLFPPAQDEQGISPGKHKPAFKALKRAHNLAPKSMWGSAADYFLPHMSNTACAMVLTDDCQQRKPNRHQMDSGD